MVQVRYNMPRRELGYASFPIVVCGTTTAIRLIEILWLWNYNGLITENRTTLLEQRSNFHVIILSVYLCMK